MKTIILIIALCTGMQFMATGQNKHHISGKVLDLQNLPVTGATLQILNTNRLSIADENGSFQFKDLPAGKFILKISAIGYATINTPLIIPSNEILTIRLTSNNLKLDEVTVSAQKREENIQNLPLSISAFTAARVQAAGMANIKDLKTIVPNLMPVIPVMAGMLYR